VGRKNQGFVYEQRLDRSVEGQALLAYLAERHRHSSREDWRRRIEDGQVELAGRPARADERLVAGQLLVWRRPPWAEADVPLGFALLYEDADLLGVAKPRGLPTLPAGGFLESTLLRLVRDRYPQATLAHRLGRGTSGLVVACLSPLARSHVARCLREATVRKTYRALVCGCPQSESFEVDVPIGPVPHPVLGTVHAACRDGRPALTRVRLLERRGDTSLAEVEIVTGRPHQIRAHLAAVGHPLLGDPLFATGGGVRPAALPGEGGYWLHAHKLRLPHPRTGLRLELECAPPPLLREGGGAGRLCHTASRELPGSEPRG
jgi:23S rRNA pseudouridine1911/1915/1917 synthase